jgi:DNA-binding transcriptional LysR family regulator
MQIKQLEDQLGVKLFHRTTRRVDLTSEGVFLLECARRAEDELREGLRQIQESVDIVRGQLTVGCVPTFAANRLPTTLAIFQKKYPGISVSIREEVMSELLETIRDKAVDFGIGPKVENRTEFVFRPLFFDQTYALLPESYKIQNEEGTSIDELAQFPLLFFTSSTAARVSLDAAFQSRNLAYEVKYQVMQPHTIVAMVEASVGAAILPGIAVPQGEKTRLKAIPIIDPPMGRVICIVTLRGQELSPAASKLVNLVEKHSKLSTARKDP